MAIRITLECGHASMLRARTTPEGYTHDWEVFVRGVDNADIHQYIEKVVFHLHQTFPKPKRVLKEPPFVVKESGYAGFVIPINIYLKNKDEPKKFEILYDLQLQNSGPAINNVLRHSEVISNPSDDFRRKLLKGGAAVVSSTEGSTEKSESKTPTMVGKPKLSGSEAKKHRLIETKTSNSFAELFGTPLKPTKVSQDNKKTPQPEKSSVPKPVVTAEKSDRIEKTSKVKDSPHKDNKKEKVDDKKDKKVKDLSKDRNRSKEKSKRPSSPGGKSHSSPTSKRPASPVSLKRPASPSLPPAKRPPSPKSKEKEIKKVIPDKDKDKEKDKIKDTSKSALDTSKSEKRKDKKKHKEDRDKERKDKYKDGQKSSVKEAPKLGEKKPEKPEKTDKTEKEKSQEYKSTKDGRKSPKPQKEVEKPKDEKLVKVEKPEKIEKSDKSKDGKSEKDRQKHKHKKRDKKDRRDSSKEREKKEKRDRIKVSSEKQNNVPNVPIANPLSTLLAEMPERDSSDSAPSVDDDAFSEPKPPPAIKKEAEDTTVPVIPPEPTKPLSPVLTDVKKEKQERNKRDKTSRSRGEDRENRKRKRRSESKGDDDHQVKREKGDRGHSMSPPLEPVSSSQSPVVVDPETVHGNKDKEERGIQEQTAEKGNEADGEQVAPDSTNSTLVDSDISEPPVLSEDYVSQLKDLQQKIMTLQDNQELQRVVQVIAETGQYEITKKTFDFDLCALDRRTVQRLQQFFTAS